MYVCMYVYILGLLRPPDFFNRLTVRKKTGKPVNCVYVVNTRHVYKKRRQRRRPGGVVDIQVGGTACDSGLAGNRRLRAQRRWSVGV